MCLGVWGGGLGTSVSSLHSVWSSPFTPCDPGCAVLRDQGARRDRLFPLSPLPLPGQPMTFPPEALWVTVGLSVCLVALLVALAFVCWRKIKQSCEEENAGE